MDAHVSCPDCGARYSERGGPTHAYVGGSPECWAAFGELSQRELELGIGGQNRLSVHVYMVQHPGREGRREAQSVGVHLMVLAAVLERGFMPADAVGAMPAWLSGRPTFPWLTPPTDRAARTIQTVGVEVDPQRHNAEVRRWAEAVWSSWQVHAPTIRQWLDAGKPLVQQRRREAP